MGASKAQLNWVKDLPFYLDIVKEMGEYDDSFDYVGPQRRKLLVKLVPRKILLRCDINIVAWIHDFRYRIGGTLFEKKMADAEFLSNLMFWIDVYVWPGEDIKFIGWLIAMNWEKYAQAQAWYYYVFVRMLGKSSFNFIKE